MKSLGFVLLFFCLTVKGANFAPVGSISDVGTMGEEKLINELDSAYDGTFQIQKLPNQRAVQYIIKSKQDFHYPVLLPLSNVKRKFDYAFSKVTVSSIVYAVYVNKNNSKISLHNLQDFLVEGESGHVDFFDFKVIPSNCVECSFKKVESARIDGYIYPALEGDKIIQKLKLKNIDSYYFDTYEMKFALPQNPRGKAMDELLTSLFERLKGDKEFNDIYTKINKANLEWQPTRKLY